MFLFHCNKKHEVNVIANTVEKSRGCLTFQYKIGVFEDGSVHTLRIYNTQNLNQPMIDLLVHEFTEMNGYQGYIEVTLEKIRNPLYEEVLCFNEDDIEKIKPYCHEGGDD